MKNFLLALFILLSVNLYSQEYKAFEKEVVVECDLSKKTLWINLKSWVSSSFNNYNRAVDMEDSDAGTLILKSSALLPIESILTKYGCGNYLLFFTLKVDCRENKFRISVYDIYSQFIEKSVDYSRLSANTLSELLKEQYNIIFISSKYFNKNVKWTIDDDFITIINDLSNDVEQLKTELSNIDRKANRSQREEYDSKMKKLESSEKDFKLLSDIYIRSQKTLNVFVNNLFERMKISDDF